MTEVQAIPAPVAQPMNGRAIAAASLGNALEWYDFTIYVMFAIYIAPNFFPGGSDTEEFIKACLAFGVGFVVRPLGAVIVGVYSDRAGRKAALTLTIALMALGTLVLAVAPTYAAVGIGAPLILLVGRVLQGFSAGGEVGGAATFLVESAPPGRRGIYAAWLQASMAISNLLGAFVALAVTTALTSEQVAAWGWRIPFFIGLLIAPVGWWLRRTLEEPQEFVQAARNLPVGGRVSPLRRLFTDHRPELAQGFGLSVLWAVAIYALVIFMPIHAQRTLGFAAHEAFGASFVGNIALAASCFLSGWLADRVGGRRVAILSAIGLFVFVAPLMFWLTTMPEVAVLVIVQSLLCVLAGLLSGAAPSLLAQSFPTEVRATGMSLSYNAAVTIFGGFAPAILTAMAASQLGPMAPAAYVAAAALVALPALFAFRR